MHRAPYIRFKGAPAGPRAGGVPTRAPKGDLVRGWFLLLVLVVIAAVDVLVPYLIIGDTPTFAASYLFWCIITLVVVVIFGFFYTARWGRGAADNATVGGDPGAADNATVGGDPGGSASTAAPGAADDTTPSGDPDSARGNPGAGRGAGRDNGGRS